MRSYLSPLQLMPDAQCLQTGQADVEFDDGDFEAGVLPKFLRIAAPEEEESSRDSSRKRRRRE